jgi:hypothetical protein
MKKYKYLIGGGCSFTEVCTPVYEDAPKQIKWLERLGLELGIEKVKTYNMGMGGAGNEFIKMNFLYKIQELLKVPDIKSSDIFVAIQWTGYERCDLFVSDEIPTIDGLDEDLQPNYFGSNYNTHKMESKPDFGWVFSGAHISRDMEYDENTHEPLLLQEYLQRWYKYYYTHQGMWVNTLNNILFVQNFCKSHNIDYVFCTSWDIVSGQDPYEGDSYRNVIEDYPGFKFLWDMIDFDRFIFYSSNISNMLKGKHNMEISDYGGMWQYMVERDGIDPDSRHPTQHGSRVWAEYILDTMKDRKLL